MVEDMALFLLLLLISSPLLVASKRYDIPSPWEIHFNSTKMVRTGLPVAGAVGYMVISNGSTEIVSDNGTYAFAYIGVSHSTTSYDLPASVTSSIEPVIMLAVIMQRKSGSQISAVPVWMGVIGSETNFTSVQLDETGNLILYWGKTLVWESFDDPDSDIMLPGQRLKHAMVSRDGDYTAQIAKRGFILYAGNYPYQVWNVKTPEATTPSLWRKICMGYQAVALYTGSELNLLYEPSSRFKVIEACEVPAMTLLRTTSLKESLILPYLQLDSTGNLVIFSYDSASRSWTPHSKTLAQTCKFQSKLNLPCRSDHQVHDSSQKQQQFDTSESNLKNANPPLIDTNKIFCLGCLAALLYYIPAIALESSSVRTIFKRMLHVCGTSINSLATMCTPRIVSAMVKRKLRVATAFMKYTTINTINYFNEAVQEMEALLTAMQGLPRRYTYMELENATQGFSTKLGAGGYGTVYRGVTQDGKHVAVKELFAIPTQSMAKRFVTEVVGIGGISHQNVVKLYGFCMDGAASKRLLVYEFMPNGSLDRWIFGNESLSWQQRLDIALGTARGLRYLHEECSEPILHLDVKPHNILLDKTFVPKLCDFGVAKLLDNRDTAHAPIMISAPGTPAYMAPELLMQKVATKKCDVYSYGLVLLEIIGGRKNTDWNKVDQCSEENAVDSSWYFPSWAAEQVERRNMIAIWDERIRPFAAEHRSQATMIVHLALWCLQNNPSTRPGFSEIVETLEGKRMIDEPPMSFHFNVTQRPEINAAAEMPTVKVAMNMLTQTLKRGMGFFTCTTVINFSNGDGVQETGVNLPEVQNPANMLMVRLKRGVLKKLTTINYFKASQEMEALLSTVQSSFPRKYTYTELKNATNGFSKHIGEGGFGCVYEGTTRDGKHVAVKIAVKKQQLVVASNLSINHEFLTEIVGIGGTSHVNVVKLYGFCFHGASKLMLVEELVPNKSLDHWIKEDKTLSWSQRLGVALGTARGLRYLHEECSKPILHLDVKPGNILLDRDFVPKLCDFGSAKFIENSGNRDDTDETTLVRGTTGYLAPEWLKHGRASKKCDVYGYGIVLLELIAGRRRLIIDSNFQKQDLCHWAVRKVIEGSNVMDIWDDKVRLMAAENREQAISMIHLAFWCIQDNPSIRPDFPEIVATLEGRTIDKPPLKDFADMYFFDGPFRNDSTTIDVSTGSSNGISDEWL